MKSLLILLLWVCISCKKANSLNTTNEKTSIGSTTNNTKENLYTEVLNMSKQTDYDLNKPFQKLDLNHNSLTVKIRYLSERAYISIENNKKEFVSWKPVHINFFYDTSLELAEKDIHILLKQNDPSEGYLLLPSFTEQFSTYSLYHFRKDTLNFIGIYEVSEFVKGTFSFDENSKNVYIHSSPSKKLKLNKIEQNQDEKFNNINEDIKLLDGKVEEKICQSDLKGTWAVICENELTELEINKNEGFLSLYSVNAIYINLKVEKSSNKNEYILMYASVSSQRNYYENELKIVDEDIDKNKPIGKLTVLENGKANLDWIGLYNRKKQKLEFVGKDFLLISENGGKTPLILESCK
ncbi:hypothetical protein BBI01_20410 [Chryseobacterium artocarpi]|uniref:Uncharacterized protein n=1 Tax=Chryseobacterium artocarpi TaxID=1414727 RepID=A0A1B8Z998_9FLAO|nr:hypothetical protein [Chryseobacterium artocarpi]OCA68188.1 hypothetical protein BBI01_20410 [Chryseobacterium artocarpi]